MLQKFAEQGVISDSDSIHEEFFGLYAGPTFNSINQLNKDVSLAYQVFFGGKKKAEQAMDEIIELNETREKAEDDAMKGMLNGNAEQQKPDEVDATTDPDFMISTCSQDVYTSLDIKELEGFLEEYNAWRPFGVGFEKPKIELEFFPREAYWSYMGQDESHIKATLPEGLELVFFNQGHYFPDCIDTAKMPKITRIQGKLEMNIFRGNRTIQFKSKLGPDMDQSN